MFVDEAQDLDKQALELLIDYFPRAKIIILGDIFQSISKELRENLLYRLLTKTNQQGWIKLDSLNDIQIDRNVMYITPRVPEKILEKLKKVFKEHYSEKITNLPFDSWKSESDEKEADINWFEFNNFVEVYNRISNSFKIRDGENREIYDQEKIRNSMILTYTSEITVENKCGDIHRGKKILMENGMDESWINSEYKIKESNKLFMSTMASSKGLEADNVIVIVSENIDSKHSSSEDVIINLLCVAFSRCKKKLTVYYKKDGKLGPTFVNRFNEYTGELNGSMDVKMIDTLLKSHSIESLTEESDIFSSKLYRKMKYSLQEDRFLKTFRPLLDEHPELHRQEQRTHEERTLYNLPKQKNKLQTLTSKDLFMYFIIQEIRHNWLDLTHEQELEMDNKKTRIPDHLQNLSVSYTQKLSDYRKEINQPNMNFLTFQQELNEIQNLLDSNSGSSEERDAYENRRFQIFQTKFEKVKTFYCLKSLLIKRSFIENDLASVQDFYDLYYHKDVHNVYQGTSYSGRLFDFIQNDAKDTIQYNCCLYGDHLITTTPSILVDLDDRCEIWVFESNRLVSSDEEYDNRQKINAEEILYKETRLLRGINCLFNHLNANENYINLEGKIVVIKIINIFERLWYTYQLKPKNNFEINNAIRFNQENNTNYQIRRHHIEDFKLLKKDVKETILLHNLKRYLSKENHNILQKIDVNKFFLLMVNMI